MKKVHDRLSSDSYSHGANGIALEKQPGTTAERSYANNPVDEGSCVACGAA